MLQSMGLQRVGHNWETEQQPILKKKNASTFSVKLQQTFLIKMETWLKFENKSLKLYIEKQKVKDPLFYELV